ncbi:MAG: hypothetical protein IPO94_08710 [Saprospiraceae bacterium]|nr:hypothetical protein [Saprospiraceae bacterium]
MNKLNLTISLVALAQFLSAQTTSSGGGMLFYSLVAVCAIVVIWAILSLSSNLMKIEANKYGLNTEGSNMGVFPGIRDFLKPKDLILR